MIPFINDITLHYVNYTVLTVLYTFTSPRVLLLTLLIYISENNSLSQII